MKTQFAIVFLAAALGSLASVPENKPTAPAVTAVENLTLEQAFEMADSLQPQIAEAKALVQAADGRARQAGAFPNPEAILGAQQLPLSGNQGNEREYVAGLGQTLPLGRRLSRAREAEMLDREVRARGSEVKRREIHRRVHSAFATALYQERAWQAQSEIVQNATKAVTVTHARVEAGDTPKEDLARVEMELARAKVEAQRAESLCEQARVGLAAAIGDASLRVTSLAGTMDATFEIPTVESLVANLWAQPETAMAEADLRARAARVDVAKAERIPDLKVELLYHRLEASGANTLDVGLSIPLPLFDRSQGRLKEAAAEEAAAEARARMTRNDLSTRLRESCLQLTAALASSRTVKTEILARADTVLETAEARYAAGDISLMEILPVRRDWAAVQLSYLESLRDVMRAWAELSGSLGLP
ncbi:MAG TPA: TolC family protein [Verrucomicrobiota bacterium]|mgnify:CR=1 FL=1|nr:TolC family protein [Verrucomicrobiota bacterium]HRZ36731.1 TolC family protein [Candidatus Paceibacterota bacterium]HRZ55046.1 TolC family protein [Candidatus Paceibacterota bacterium]